MAETVLLYLWIFSHYLKYWHAYYKWYDTSISNKHPSVRLRNFVSAPIVCIILSIVLFLKEHYLGSKFKKRNEKS